jgi:hypothetical protein
MKLFDKYIDAEDIKAEVIVSQLNLQEFNVRNSGIFSRNYSDDLISLREENNLPMLELSRDGIFHLLPEGLFFKENRLKINDKHVLNKENEKIKEEKRRIDLFFQPFETRYFQLSLELESRINEIAERGNSVFTNFLFEGMEVNIENQYIRKLFLLFPYLSELRGNLDLLRNLLKIIFSAKVEIRKNGLSLFFVIHRCSLVQNEYFPMDDEITVFFDFFTEWFLPIESDVDFRIKDYEENFTLGGSLLLDYNTHFYF